MKPTTTAFVLGMLVASTAALALVLFSTPRPAQQFELITCLPTPEGRPPFLQPQRGQA